MLRVVDKKLTREVFDRSFGSPGRAARTMIGNPQAVAFGGAGGAAALSGGATRDQSDNVRRKRDAVASTVYGGVGGQAAYQGAIFGSKLAEEKKTGTMFNDPKTRRDYKDPKHKEILEGNRKGGGHKRAYGLKNPNVPSDFKGYNRNYPLELPGARHVRTNAHLTTGKTGFAVGTAATVTGAALGLAAHRKIAEREMAGKATARGKKEKVHKALYVRERKPSLLRAAETGVGLGLAAWGLGRSGMVGRALARGVRFSQNRNDVSAVYALQLAQAAQGILRSGTAPAERNVRRIRAINQAINAVPRPIRPEVATAAGALLASHGHPIRRDSYRQVGVTGHVGFR